MGEWNHTPGMIVDALVTVALKTGRDADIDYTRAWLDGYVAAGGTLE